MSFVGLIYSNGIVVKVLEDFFQDNELLGQLKKIARQRRIDSGEVIINPGDEIKSVPLVLAGSVRILRVDEDSREVFLYHLSVGQTCAMSLTCCQAGHKSMVKAIAETDAELLFIPAQYAEEWMIFPEWKAFVSLNYAQRFSELLQVIDLISFNHMDKQLLHYLEERSKALGSRILEFTHQQIADELHAHREAISRLLRTMESKGLLKLGRNNLTLLK